MGGTVVVVTSGKGGVGKTTTAINVGVALRSRDNAIAIVDADLGMANLGTMIGVENDTTLHEVLAGDAPLSDAVVEGAPGFGVVTGDRELQAYADADPGALPGVVDQLRAQYDYVVLDAGAGLGYEDVLPVGLADEVILVTTPDPAALDDVDRLNQFSEVVDASVRGLVLNRVTAETDVESIFDRLDVDPLGVVPEDPSLGESTAEGTPIEQYAPESPGAAAYRRLAAVLADEEAPSLSVPGSAPTGDAEGTDGTAGETGETTATTDGTGETETKGEGAAEADATDGAGGDQQAGSEEADGAKPAAEETETDTAPEPEAGGADAEADQPTKEDRPTADAASAGSADESSESVDETASATESTADAPDAESEAPTEAEGEPAETADETGGEPAETADEPSETGGKPAETADEPSETGAESTAQADPDPAAETELEENESDDATEQESGIRGFIGRLF